MHRYGGVTGPLAASQCAAACLPSSAPERDRPSPAQPSPAGVTHNTIPTSLWVYSQNADVEHDFLKDPVRCKRDGDWIAAVGTTLGADNGVGAATALALLDMPASAKLPPLECLVRDGNEWKGVND